MAFTDLADLQRKVESARQAGIPEDQIRSRVAQEMQSFSSPSQGNGSNFLLDALPVLGGIAGSFTPLGPLAGGGIGSALGTALKQHFSGQPFDIGEVMGQGALGVAGGALGKVAGPAFRILTGRGLQAGAQTGGRAAADILGQSGADAAAQTTGETAGNVLSRTFNPAKTASLAFNVPPRLAGKLDPLRTIKDLQAYDLFPKTPETAQGIVDSITGQNGIVNKMVSNAIGSVKGEIDPGIALTGLRSTLGRSGALDDALKADTQKTISNIIYQTTGKGVGTLNPLEALQAMRDLEKQGYQFLTASEKPLSTNALRDKQLADAYLGAADDIQAQLEKAVGSQNLVPGVKTPQIQQALFAISPKLATKVASAATISDLRSIQAPFYRLGRMLELTDAANQGAFSAAGNKLGSRAIGAVAGGGIAGVPGAIAGAAAAPFVEAAAEGVRFPALMAIAQAQSLFGKGGGIALDKAGQVIGTAGAQSTVRAPFTASTALAQTSPDQTSQLPATAPAVSPGGQWKFDPTANDWVPNDRAQAGGNPTQSGDLLSRDRAVAAMVSDLAATGGKHINEIAAIYKIGQNPKSKVTSANQTKLGALETAKSIVNEIETSIQPIVGQGGAENRVTGAWRSMMGNLGLDPQVSTYKTYREGIANILTKALGQGGNLSDTDIKLAIRLIPDVGDTSTEAAIKIKRLRGIIDQSQTGIMNIGSQTDAIPDTAGASSGLDLNNLFGQ